MSKTMTFRDHSTESSDILKQRNEKVDDDSVFLAELHRSIRLSNWQAIVSILEHSRRGQSLLLRPNSIGWTALHFVSLHGTPNYIWFIWVLQRAKEDYLQTVHLLGKGIKNPFHARTNAGHSPIDLYFAKALYPFPWELNDVVRRAFRLRRTIATILTLDSHHDIISELKQKICDKMKEAQLRLKNYMNDDQEDIQSSIIWDRDIRFLVPQDVIECSNNVQQDEVELEMAASQHYNESEDDEYIPWDETSQLSENDKTKFVEFWHQMEILVLVTTRLNLFLDDCEYLFEREDQFTSSTTRHWNILHALAWTGAPEEVAKLAVKLYPLQLKIRDEDGNLPLHIACSSHKASSLADGTWNHNRHQKPYGDVSLLPCVPFMISQLLQGYPAAAKEQDSNGRYPINIALMAGKAWNDGISSLFLAFPLAVMNLDALNNLPSFLLAASNARPSDENILNDGPSFDEEMRAKCYSNKRFGCTWGILPMESKRKVLEHAKKESEIIKITTVYELLRRMPGSIYCFNSLR